MPRVKISLALATAVVMALAVEASPSPTLVVGRVLDPVADAGIAGASVRLGNQQVSTAEDGSYSARIGKRKADHVGVSFSAPGFEEYRSWTATGTETRRDPYLFPVEDVYLPGLAGHHSDFVSAELLQEHFDWVYRSEDQSDSRIRRWVEQPDVRIVNHIVEWRDLPEDEVEQETIDGATYTYYTELVASDRRTPPKVMRRLKKALRDSLGPLTGGFLSGDRVRRRRVQPGESLGRSRRTADIAPLGELVVYVHGDRARSTAVLRLQGDTIVGGALFMYDEVFLRSADVYTPGLLLHELGHVLNMNHAGGWLPSKWYLGTPLCSVVSQRECERGHKKLSPSPVDLITARLAYSRLPGNDRDDVDPDPRLAARKAQGDRFVWSHWAPHR